MEIDDVDAQLAAAAARPRARLSRLRRAGAEGGKGKRPAASPAPRAPPAAEVSIAFSRVRPARSPDCHSALESLDGPTSVATLELDDPDAEEGEASGREAGRGGEGRAGAGAEDENAGGNGAADAARGAGGKAEPMDGADEASASEDDAESDGELTDDADREAGSVDLDAAPEEEMDEEEEMELFLARQLEEERLERLRRKGAILPGGAEGGAKALAGADVRPALEAVGAAEKGGSDGEASARSSDGEDSVLDSPASPEALRRSLRARLPREALGAADATFPDPAPGVVAFSARLAAWRERASAERARLLRTAPTFEEVLQQAEGAGREEKNLAREASHAYGPTRRAGSALASVALVSPPKGSPGAKPGHRRGEPGGTVPFALPDVEIDASDDDGSLDIVDDEDAPVADDARGKRAPIEDDVIRDDLAAARAELFGDRGKGAGKGAEGAFSAGRRGAGARAEAEGGEAAACGVGKDVANDDDEEEEEEEGEDGEEEMALEEELASEEEEEEASALVESASEEEEEDVSVAGGAAVSHAPIELVSEDEVEIEVEVEGEADGDLDAAADLARGPEGVEEASSAVARASTTKKKKKSKTAKAIRRLYLEEEAELSEGESEDGAGDAGASARRAAERVARREARRARGLASEDDEDEDEDEDSDEDGAGRTRYLADLVTTAEEEAAMGAELAEAREAAAQLHGDWAAKRDDADVRRVVAALRRGFRRGKRHGGRGALDDEEDDDDERRTRAGDAGSASDGAESSSDDDGESSGGDSDDLEWLRRADEAALAAEDDEDEDGGAQRLGAAATAGRGAAASAGGLGDDDDDDDDAGAYRVIDRQRPRAGASTPGAADRVAGEAGAGRPGALTVAPGAAPRRAASLSDPVFLSRRPRGFRGASLVAAAAGAGPEPGRAGGVAGAPSSRPDSAGREDRPAASTPGRRKEGKKRSFVFGRAGEEDREAEGATGGAAPPDVAPDGVPMGGGRDVARRVGPASSFSRRGQPGASGGTLVSKLVQARARARGAEEEGRGGEGLRRGGEDARAASGWIARKAR